jgi:hypothetical protein
MQEMTGRDNLIAAPQLSVRLETATDDLAEEFSGQSSSTKASLCRAGRLDLRSHC